MAPHTAWAQAQSPASDENAAPESAPPNEAAALAEPAPSDEAAAPPDPAHADEAAAPSKPVGETVEAVDPVAVAPPPPATEAGPEIAAPLAKSETPAPPPFEVSGAPGKGLTLKVGDTFSLNLKSRIQLRYQLHIPQAEDGAARQLDQLVTVGTLRLYFSGNIFTPALTYMIQLALAARDYRDQAISPVYDAYLDYAVHRDLHVRAGQYFVPFDRLRTVREFALQMTDRPRPVAEFTLDRDVGITSYSESFLGDHSPLAWRVGVFGGGGNNLTTSKKPGALVVGRVELRPFGAMDDDQEGDLERRVTPGLAIGTGFAANYNTNRLRSTTGATFQGGTTDYRHAAADLVFKWRGWALQAEYLRKQASADTIISTDAEGDPLVEYTRSGQGWVVQTSYTFDPPFELVARVSRMYAFAGTDPTLVTEVEDYGQELGAGLNYYLNGHRMKVQTDWIARMPYNFNMQAADQVVRAQLDVTF